MEGEKKRGFTLIELLATIVIISIIFAVGGYVIYNVIEKTEKSSKDVSIASIKKGAGTYILEYKQMDKFWFKGENNTEYACTTVGSLIDKGILKQNVLGLKVEVEGKEEEIKKDTSIRVERDQTTKTYKDEVLFNTESCEEDFNIEVEFEVSGPSNEGYSDWYNNDVTIKIKATKSKTDEKITSSDVTWYQYLYNEQHKEYHETGEVGEGWTITVDEQGRDIDICIKIYSIKEKETVHCLSQDEKGSLVYNMDKEKPSNPSLSLVLDKTKGYQLTSTGASDNITIANKLEYHLPEQGGKSTGSISYLIDKTTRIPEGKKVITYVVDEAGNKSEEISRNLIINDSETVSTTTKYYCSLNDEIAYDTSSEADAACQTQGEVMTIKYYYCSLDSDIISTDKSEVEDLCYEEGKVIRISGGCKLDGYEDDGYCYYDYEVEGWKIDYLKCSGGIWVNNGKPDNSDYGCDPEYATDRNVRKGKYDEIDYWKNDDAKCSQEYKKYWKKSCDSPGEELELEQECYQSCTLEYETEDDKYLCDVTDEFVESKRSECILEGDIKNKKRYYCKIDGKEYTSSTKAERNCIETGNVSNKYYCSITNKYYDTLSSAKNACTNHCSKGNNYNNACYSLE